MKIKITILGLLIAALFSCNEYESSEIESYYSDSIPKLKVFYKYHGNNLYVAKKIRYYPNGQIESEGELNKNGKKNGEWKYFYNYGEKWRIENYKNGAKNGKIIEWYKNGNKMYEGYYKDGLIDGKWTVWDEDGNKINTIKYKNGKPVN